jgi:hypothetical protein
MDVFPFDIGEQINNCFFRQVVYDYPTGRWIVLDNDRGKAEQLKQMMPTVPVFLYNKTTNTYTRFTIDLLIPKMTMKDGHFVEEFVIQTV